ncbi:LytTR family DNA-binding domain-containing protein [Aquimarina sp. AU58]|uniref:LytR/AlgR family response regulator transcription factor n=1 Tax=Aquimarina sp. AU58 TaxID=1874112 RepID=UPI000D64DBB1|nr:LytTR family DNA-binding domain-containing protein [Aquimarina sp. AU58]
MLKAIIVDDEQLAIDALRWELETHCSDVEILCTIKNAEEAIDIINGLKPDVLFLDIEMPELDGFQLLKRITSKDFDIIFTTAYDSYAVKAFKASAIDYLLKPIEKEELCIAIEKVLSNKQNKSLGASLRLLMEENFINPTKHNSKINLPMDKKILLVNSEDILYCESEGSYTYVIMSSGKKHCISRNLKQFELQLPHNNFLRIHQSYVINLNAIKEYHRGDGGEVILHNGKNIPVSRSKKQNLLELILK